MGQINCCTTANAEQMNQLEFDNYKFDQLDYNRCSTYEKLDEISNNIVSGCEICMIIQNRNSPVNIVPSYHESLQLNRNIFLVY